MKLRSLKLIGSLNVEFGKLAGLGLAAFDPKISTSLVKNFWYLRRVSTLLAEVVTSALLGI